MTEHRLALTSSFWVIQGHHMRLREPHNNARAIARTDIRIDYRAVDASLRGATIEKQQLIFFPLSKTKTRLKTKEVNGRLENRQPASSSKNISGHLNYNNVLIQWQLHATV